MDLHIKNLIDNKERFLYPHIDINYLNKKVPKSKSNLKVCVLLSGGLRNFKYTIPWINKFLIEPLDADVFVHGWANAEGIANNEDKLKDIKNLKDFKINDINDIKFNFLKDDDTIKERIKGQFYNIFECNNLSKKYEKNNNFIYDIIIRARPDVFFFSEFEDEDLIKIKKDNVLALPKEYFKIWSGNTTDTFAMGNRYVMDLYCDTYKYVENSFYGTISPEQTLEHNLKNYMKHISFYNIYPTYIIDYPHDLVTDTAHLSPKISNLSNSVTNRLLYQNDIKK